MRTLAFALALSLYACGGAAPVAKPPVVVAGPDFARDEDRVLRLLASADGRFAARAGIVSDESELRGAGVQAILSEDTTTVMEGGRADLFSFDTRARALDAATKMLAQYTQNDRQNGLEIERLKYTLEAERARLAYERELPAGAAPLFVGLAATWPVNAPPADAEQHDARLAKRFEQVMAALGSISPEVRDELEASLDPIEAKLSPAYAKSQIALVRLRVRLGETRVDAAPKTSNVDASLEPRLRALEKRLRELAAPLAKHAPPPAPSTLPCKLTGSPGTTLGRMIAPPERQRVCVIVKTLASAPVDPLVAMSLHDDVVVALWALAIASGLAPSAATGGPRPMAETSPHQEASWTRRAALHPGEAIDTALAIDWILSDPQKNASAWDSFGDAPIDLAIRELAR